MAVGGVCAALTLLAPRLLGRRDSGGWGSVLLGGVPGALIPLVFHALTGLGVVEAMIASAIMPLVPGLSMTNAVQDILRGDMVSGVTHAARAVMIAALLAGGALEPAGRRAFSAEWKADPLAASYAVKVRREPQPAAECAAVG